MYNHAPDDYDCPLCLIVKGIEGEYPYTKQADIVYRDDLLIAFISSHWWPNNKGHVLIAPLEHVENLYDLLDTLGHVVFSLSQKIALALKATYNCDGTSIRQHNEPAGGQDVWHYHLQVLPRYQEDKLYENDALRELSRPEERLQYTNKLKEYLKA